jgi:membrane-bound metal-dependent hydrolase YbcI (DUF457 family)
MKALPNEFKSSTLGWHICTFSHVLTWYMALYGLVLTYPSITNVDMSRNLTRGCLKMCGRAFS